MKEFWDRVEPNTGDPTLEEGLQARVADPMWMLARQWQFGEFRGEDAASPVHARVRLSSMRVRTFASQGDPNRTIERIPDDVPLECRVEAERVWEGPAALRLAAEAGLQFLRRWEEAGGTGLRSLLRATFPLQIGDIEVRGLPPRQIRRLELLTRRAIDGWALYRAQPSAFRVLSLTPAQRRLFREIWVAWRADLEDTFHEPRDGGETWVEQRLEYGFSIGAATSSDQVVLSADEYPGGRLDWYSFDVDAQADHGAGSGRTLEQTYSFLPTPVTFRGMPASRWWEFEDREVYFGDIAAGPADLARMILAEFATVYRDDWYLCPLRVPAGSLSRVSHLQVLDTFGHVHDIAATALNDQNTYGDDRPWRVFELAGDPSAAEGNNPWLFVAPALASTLDGRPVEQVALVRDEVANVVWGIEQIVETVLGRRLRRRQQWATARRSDEGSSDAGAAAADPESGSDLWRYTLSAEVPPYWVPFVPERQGDGVAMRLRRARMQAWDLLDRHLVGAQGKILAPERPLRLYEEEIPRGGLHVSRAWQAARGADGDLHLWMARRKRPGRGQRGSGLEMDRIDRNE